MSPVSFEEEFKPLYVNSRPLNGKDVKNILERIKMDLSIRFNQLVERWRMETEFLSSTTKMIEHPAYQEIIKMGPDVIPLIMKELWEEGGHWHSALKEITGANPVPQEHVGQIPLMGEYWQLWYLQQEPQFIGSELEEKRHYKFINIWHEDDAPLIIWTRGFIWLATHEDLRPVCLDFWNSGELNNVGYLAGFGKSANEAMKSLSDKILADLSEKVLVEVKKI